jgi:hypothetical protein
MIYDMKRLFLLSLAFLAVNLTFAGNADLFRVDEQELNTEFADLSALENFVQSNNFISLHAIVDGNLYDVSAINISTMAASSQSSFAFQWEGFLWGFLCCPVGLFVIALNENKDKDQKLSYWVGVAAATVLSAITAPAYYY